MIPPEPYERIIAHLRRGKRLQTLNNSLRMYHVRCRWADVPPDDFHALRKTAITNWLEAGVPPHEVQRMAGHSSIETTMKHYAKVDRSTIDRVRETSVGDTGGQAHVGAG